MAGLNNDSFQPEHRLHDLPGWVVRVGGGHRASSTAAARSARHVQCSRWAGWVVGTEQGELLLPLYCLTHYCCCCSFCVAWDPIPYVLLAQHCDSEWLANGQIVSGEVGGGHKQGSPSAYYKQGSPSA